MTRTRAEMSLALEEAGLMVSEELQVRQTSGEDNLTDTAAAGGITRGLRLILLRCGR